MRGKERDAGEVARDTSTVPESVKSIGGNCGLRRAIVAVVRHLGSGSERGNGQKEEGNKGASTWGRLGLRGMQERVEKRERGRFPEKREEEGVGEERTDGWAPSVRERKR
jgi:hypothetical protein